MKLSEARQAIEDKKGRSEGRGSEVEETRKQWFADLGSRVLEVAEKRPAGIEVQEVNESRMFRKVFLYAQFAESQPDAGDKTRLQVEATFAKFADDALGSIEAKWWGDGDPLWSIDEAISSGKLHDFPDESDKMLDWLETSMQEIEKVAASS
jgi:hypothetical protein